jgi:hypothetical protein
VRVETLVIHTALQSEVEACVHRFKNRVEHFQINRTYGFYMFTTLSACFDDDDLLMAQHDCVAIEVDGGVEVGTCTCVAKNAPRRKNM